MIFTVP